MPFYLMSRSSERLFEAGWSSEAGLRSVIFSGRLPRAAQFSSHMYIVVMRRSFKLCFAAMCPEVWTIADLFDVMKCSVRATFQGFAWIMQSSAKVMSE